MLLTASTVGAFSFKRSSLNHSDLEGNRSDIRCFDRGVGETSRVTTPYLAIDTQVPNLIVPIPDCETPRPKRVGIVRHPSNQCQCRRMQYPIRRLVVVFTPHPHAKPIAAQRPVPSVAWYQANIAVVDNRLHGMEAFVKEG